MKLRARIYLRLGGKKMTAAQLDGLVQDEEIYNVRCWRYAELLRAGFEDDDAIELAFHHDIDLHEATGLVRRGCPSSTAVRILL
jgi:hypothetical protein